MLAPIRTTWRALTRRIRWERELDDELQMHAELRAADLARSGTAPAEAARRARIELGSAESYKEQAREAFGLRGFDELRQDLRYAGRALRRSRAFTGIAVLSLGLGIGANTALFTLIESALWRPIAVPHPEQLRLLAWISEPDRFGVAFQGDVWTMPDGHTHYGSFTYPIYQELVRQNSVFESLFGFKKLGRITAVVDTNAESVNCYLVSGGFYRGIGIVPVQGRSITPEDLRAGAEPVAAISYEYWTRRFGREAAAIGKKILLNQVSVKIVGVNPPSFTGVEPGVNPEIWAPLHLQPRIFPMRFAENGSLLDDGKVWWLSVMGRVKPGISDAQVQSFVETIITRRVDADLPGMRAHLHPRFVAEPGARGLDSLPRVYGKALLVLLALAGLVLLIACANVATLLLAQSAARQREISLRLALGAGRKRIVRQFLTEGVMLASLAGAAGILLGYWTRSAIPALLATSWRPSPFEAVFDPKVLLISIAMTLGTGILFSMAPAWQTRRVEVNDASKDGSRATASLSKLRGANCLVVSQVSISLLLLIGAGLLVNTFLNLKATPAGFDPNRLLLFTLDPPALRYPGERAADLFAKLQSRMDAIPGVQSTTFSMVAMLSHIKALSVVNTGGEPPEVRQSSFFNEVGSRFFETMGIPILRGRALDERDRTESPRSVVVSREFARHFFHRDDAVGESFTNSGRDGITTYRIVGICADTRYGELRDAIKPILYLYFPQNPHDGSMTVEVKFAGDAAGVMRQIRLDVASVDPELAVTDMRTQTEQIEDTLSQERLLAWLGMVFGGLALVLACIGIYGVMAYAVARRTGEIGIRVALGAEPGRVGAMVVRQAMLLVLTGIAMGVPAAIALSRIIRTLLYGVTASNPLTLAGPATRSLLYGITATDPLTIAGAAGAMMLAGAVAASVPARRAARVDPMTALRHE